MREFDVSGAALLVWPKAVPASIKLSGWEEVRSGEEVSELVRGPPE